MKVFLLNFLVRWISVGGDFPQISGWKTRGAARNIGLRRISAWENWMEKLKFFTCVLCVYLFFYYLFFYCLFVGLFFIYFYGGACWVMHQLCDLAPLEGVWSCYFCEVLWRFWWVSSGLSHFPVGLMQDVMKSLHSFLTYCYYCLYLFILVLSIVSV